MTKQNRHALLFIKFSSNDRALDLISVLIDLGDFGVAIEALYLEAPDVGGAAKNLDSVSGLCNGLVAGEVLLVGDEGGTSRTT